MSWTVSNLQRPFREDFSLEKSGIIAEKESQIFGRRFVGFDSRKSGALFQFLKGRWLQRLKRQAGEDLSGLIFLQQEDRSHGHQKHKPSASLPRRSPYSPAPCRLWNPAGGGRAVACPLERRTPLPHHRQGQRILTPERCSFNWRQSSTTPLGTQNTKPCGCGGYSLAANQ